MSLNNINALLKYQKEKEDSDPILVEHKFTATGITIKVKIPLYESESEEAFLNTIKEFQTMVDTYNFLDNIVLVQQTYRFFNATVKGPAKDAWLGVLGDNPVSTIDRDCDS